MPSAKREPTEPLGWICSAGGAERRDSARHLVVMPNVYIERVLLKLQHVNDCCAAQCAPLKRIETKYSRQTLDSLRRCSITEGHQERNVGAKLVPTTTTMSGNEMTTARHNVWGDVGHVDLQT